MKWIFAAITTSILAFSGNLRGAPYTEPSEWHSSPLATVTSANPGNGWYFCPDTSNNPRILVKGTSANANGQRLLLEGGPPEWTAGNQENLGTINKQGVFVPTSGGGGFLVAPHSVVGSLPTEGIKVARFAPNGSSTLEMAFNTEGTYTGLSANLDENGILHLGYIRNGNTLCYARRNGANTYDFTWATLPGVIEDTAIVPSGTGAVHLYYTYIANAAPNIRLLYRAKPGFLGQTLYIYWGNTPQGSNPLVRVEEYVGRTIGGTFSESVGRLLYFSVGGTQPPSWDFNMITGTGPGVKIETAGNVSPKSIRIGTAPDGLMRVAWYNVTNKRIHYLKQNGSGLRLVGFPVQLSGNLDDPDVLGLHFDPSGTPYVLYRTGLATGFVAFPSDDFDLNGNGRKDMLDSAFGSIQRGLEVLPLAPSATGVPNSQNRFKIKFPTVGTATSNGFGSIASANRGFRYTVEVSSNMVNWTPLTTGASISYTQTDSMGSGDNTMGTFVGVLPATEPATNRKRFARLSVTRSPNPY